MAPTARDSCAGSPTRSNSRSCCRCESLMAQTQVVVIGAGPGGYAAAFYAADLGMQVALVDPEANPGGVCLYRGCIPSKALLHIAALVNEADHAKAWGVSFAPPSIDIDQV